MATAESLIWLHMSINVDMLVYKMQDLYLGCLDLYFRYLDSYFGCLDLYLGVWTCISCLDLYFECLDLYSGYCILVVWDYGVRAPSTTPWSMCLPQALVFLENDAPDLLSTYIVNLVNVHEFEGLLVFSQIVGNLFT